MSMALLLSHPLHRGTPVFPGTPGLTVTNFQEIEVDGSRSSQLTFNTHTGTHIDLPAHFHKGGADASELPAMMTLSPAYCLDIPTDGDKPLRLDDLPDGLDDAEAILIRTEGHQDRRDDPQRYREEHPWIHPDAADRLLLLPRLKVVGIDTISAASPSYPQEGAETHLRLLRPERPVLILEDLDLSAEELTRGRWTLHIVPLIVDNVESTPVTVFAEPF